MNSKIPFEYLTNKGTVNKFNFEAFHEKYNRGYFKRKSKESELSEVAIPNSQNFFKNNLINSQKSPTNNDNLTRTSSFRKDSGDELNSIKEEIEDSFDEEINYDMNFKNINSPQSNKKYFNFK